MKLVHKLLCVALFTASCDLFLTVQIGGTLRLAQLMMLFVMIAAVARIIEHGRILWPRGAGALAVWVFWQGVCVPLAGNFGIAIQFYVLLIFTALSWLATVQLYGESEMVESLMRAYIWSFITIAFYGILQFFCPLLLHITLPFTPQWLVHGRVARISGFSYEPSYFATYMFLGYVMMTDLWHTGSKLINNRLMKSMTVTVCAVLILSSSKTAWLCILVDGVARVLPKVWARVRNSLAQLKYGRVAIPIPGRRTVGYVSAGVLTLVALSIFVLVVLPNPMMLLNGTGIGGSAAHSYNDRNSAVTPTIEVFKQSPLMGVSMGGVPVAVGALNGLDTTTMSDARQHWGFPVLLDVLAGSGIIGFLPFAFFLWINTFGALRTAKQYMPLECAKWLHALARAMILEWILLLGDQNLFRIYLWFHFGMVTLVMYYVEYGRHRAAARRTASITVELAANTLVPTR